MRQATAALERADNDACVLAGGQSLIPLLNQRVLRPQYVIDISRLPQLQQLEATDKTLYLGAGVTQRQVERWAGIHWPLMTETLALVGKPATRNRGTVCGSLAHADPAAELPAIALLTHARLHLENSEDQRTVDATDFFIATNKTVRNTNELVTGVTFTRPVADSGQAWVEVAQRFGDLPWVGAGASMSPGNNGDATHVRLVFSGAGDCPWDASETLTQLGGVAQLEGDVGNPATLRSLLTEVADHAAINDSGTTSKSHRRRLIRTLGARALALAHRRMRAGAPPSCSREASK